jgi:hypothetical protein
MNTNLKILLGFAAGAACASVIAGGFGREMPLEEFRDRIHFAATEVSTLGAHVVFMQKGTIWINTGNVDACMKPPPKPNEVFPTTLGIGAQAVEQYGLGLAAGNTDIIRVTSKCHPMGE